MAHVAASEIVRRKDVSFIMYCVPWPRRSVTQLELPDRVLVLAIGSKGLMAASPIESFHIWLPKRVDVKTNQWMGRGVSESEMWMKVLGKSGRYHSFSAWIWLHHA